MPRKKKMAVATAALPLVLFELIGQIAKGLMSTEVPRDCEWSFGPVLIPKHEKRSTGFDDRRVATYTRGMAVRVIQGLLAGQFGTEVSPEFISSVTDGLKGTPEALRAVFPAATLKTCIVYLIRNSLEYASRKDRKLLGQTLRPIYTAASAEAAMDAFDEFGRGTRGERYSRTVPLRRCAWERVIPILAFAPAVVQMIYARSSIESMHARLSKIIKTRSQFHGDDSATKLIWLTPKNIADD